MNEAYIAKETRSVLKDYPQYSMAVKNLPGVSDTLIQITHSRAVFIEFKFLERVMRNNEFSLSELTSDQAAFLAKWQMYGGYCFVLLGVLGPGGETKYIVIKMRDWRDWLKANKMKHVAQNMVCVTTDIEQIGKWFRQEYGPSPKNNNLQ